MTLEMHLRREIVAQDLAFLLGEKFPHARTYKPPNIRTTIPSDEIERITFNVPPVLNIALNRPCHL